jgi:hypothetical protein
MKKKLQALLQDIFHSGNYQETACLAAISSDAAFESGGSYKKAAKVLSGAICANDEDTYNNIRRLIKVWC